MERIKYSKLIRDKIPEIIEKDGKNVIVKELNDEEYINALNLKLEEELEEYKESGKVEELADIIEVIYGILAYKGISIGEFNKIRQKKAEQRGAFKRRLMLMEVMEKQE